MFCKTLLFTGVALFFAINFSFAQVKPKIPATVGEKNCEKTVVRDVRDRDENIVGSTMGQKLESLLFWSQEEKNRRFPMMQAIFPSQRVEAGKNVNRLEEGHPITPIWKDKTTLKSYMKENHIGGVMVLQNGQIRMEAYGENVDEKTLWTSFSVAKSVSSMLVGVALKEGDIGSMDDSLQQYIPELKDYDYGNVTVRQLLTMTSGITWNEDYEDHDSDVAQMYLQPCAEDEAHILSYMKKLKLDHTPGEHWNYNTGETDLVGILVQKATGKSLAEYLSEKIWKPYGMQHCAYWLADECSGMNIGGSGLSSSLRDYARLGMLMLNQGRIGKTSLLDKDWVTEATSPLFETDDKGGGYGYLWWSDKEGSYRAVGIFGQLIYINPQKEIVIAQVAAWPRATSGELTKKRADFVEAVERALW